MCKEVGARLFSVASSDMSQTQEVPLDHQEIIFYSEVDRALAQVAQGVNGVSILRHTQKLSRHILVGNWL